MTCNFKLELGKCTATTVVVLRRREYCGLKDVEGLAVQVIQAVLNEPEGSMRSGCRKALLTCVIGNDAA